MKSSNKITLRSILLLIFGFLVFSIPIAVSFQNTELSVESIIFIIILITSLIGFVLIIIKWAGSVPLYRPVDYEATPEKLIPNTTYYLNGETPATFLGQNDSKNYLFKVKGFKSIFYKNGIIDLPDYLVSEYVSVWNESDPD